MLDKFAPGIRRKIAFAKYNVAPFRSFLVLRHFTKRLLSVLGVQKGFRIIDLAITFDCNLSCEHCSAKIMQQKGTPLTLSDYQNSSFTEIVFFKIKQPCAVRYPRKIFAGVYRV